MTEGDVVEIEEGYLRVVGGLPRLLVLNGQIARISNDLTASETPIKV